MITFILCATICAVGIVLYLLQTGAACYLIRKNGRAAIASDCASDALAPVSILKPLRGLDDNLFDNLSSFCTQDYPEYELLLSLQDHNDPAYKIAKKIQEKHPERNITIIVERCATGLNPKINNLVPAYRRSRHPYILISDSNVMVEKNYLREIMRHTEDPAVGLVSNLIKGIGGRTIGARFENLHLNSFIIGSVSFLDRFLNMPCVIGKSMLMKKDDLNMLGGLENFKDILAEDFIIGREMSRAGKKVVLSHHLVSNVNEFWSIKRFLNRHTRWGKLRWKIGGYKYFSELLANPVFISAIPNLASGFSRTTLSFTALVGLIKILGDSIIGRTLESREGNSTLEKQSPFVYFLAPIKDLIIGVIWFVPFISSTVIWRGNRYRIGKDSCLLPCPETGFWSWGYRITDRIREKVA
ncbi:MAG TPA: ceramide glucosyltransferase [Nitrospirota bacterium]|nr:ceramide glucosyltransferase [Nitrospirota bacterium]